MKRRAHITNLLNFQNACNSLHMSFLTIINKYTSYGLRVHIGIYFWVHIKTYLFGIPVISMKVV